MKNKEYKPASLSVSVRKTEDDPSSEGSSSQGTHKLATIMFSDIVGFTKMMGKDEVKTMQIVEQNKQIHQTYIYNNHGILIKEMGDGLMASFDSTHDAVRCAKEIMDEVNAEGKYNLHIGIHLGDIIFTKEDIFGDGVNIAARINSCAEKGEILISEEVWKNIKNQTEFQTDYHGKRTLKNVDHSVKLYKVLLNQEKHRIQFIAIFYTHSRIIKRSAIGAMLALLMLFAYFISFDTDPIFKDAVNSIAVLPFENRTANPEYEYLSTGLAEDVISELFHLSTLSVISSRSSFRLKGSDKSINKISRELGADIVLIGNYNISDGQIDVNVEVIKGKDNEILNYASLTGNLKELGDISTQIGDGIIKTLNIPTEEKSEKSDHYRPEVNIDAYKYYAMGKNAMHDNTLQKREEIIRYFQAAIEKDSTYADPYLGIAEAYIFDVNRGYLSPVECVQKAKKYALIAEKLKPGSGEVAGIMGIIHLLDFEFKKAVPYFEKSIELSPNFDLSYHWFSFNLEALNELERSEVLLKKVKILDPLNTFNDFYLSMNLIYQKKYMEAQQLLNENLRLDPGHSQTLFQQAVLNLQQKKYQQAYESLMKRGVGLETNFIAGYTFALVGQEDRARIVLDNMLSAAEKGYVPPSQLVILYCGLQEYEQALDQLEEVFLVHDPWVLWIKYLSMVDPIRDNPGFKSLMQRIDS